ncbi:hypothetical protein LRR18_01965 [Mangrovimonas sp. AS39]|uniref:hypothetical protein n=1 Tax=Mangrovimonas futianensis TaxID=2895523 RepID=UPI001E5BC275|nr:hypothetical protein [Mangrovimonas futianensis]MCF1190334.1 hypothetical protein [Mangrovimonas futianensis]MCF1193913.1 hypothetical protein [Mangrovimonas futianensis]
MNENSTNNQSTEEVDLGQLFKLIGDAFNRLFKFIGSIFKAIFSVIIYALKAVIVNFKIIVLTMVIAGVLGFALEKISPDVYSSSMLVRPYFDSKYQLVTNINYYNALIDNQDYATFSNFFDLSEEEAQDVLSFEISAGPETENERIKEYDSFIKSLDSARASTISYEDYLENRSVYSGSIFQIEAFSLKQDIFPKLEKGLNNAFTNEYTETKKRKRDSLITIQKNNIMEQLAKVDSLQRIYINVLEEDSKSTSTELILGEGLSLSKDRSNTREYDLLNKEIELRNTLKSLEERKVEEDVFFDVISEFQYVGNKTSHWYNRYVLIFPVLAFLMLCIIYLTSRIVKFAKAYE